MCGTFGGRYFDQLALQRRAVIAEQRGTRFWVAAERLQVFRIIHPDAVVDIVPSAPLDGIDISRSDAIYSAITGWMSHIGPAFSTDLARTLGIKLIPMLSKHCCDWNLRAQSCVEHS